jgi:hypothetical protein
MSKSLKEAVESLDAKIEGRQLLIEAMNGEKPLLDPATEIELIESATDQETLAAIYESATGSILRNGGNLGDVAKLFGGKTEPAKKDPPANTGSSEIKTLQESLLKMERNQLVRDLLEEHGIQRGSLSPENRRLLESQADEAAMRQLIESWPPAVRGAKKPLIESARGGAGGDAPSFLPDDAKSFAASVR